MIPLPFKRFPKPEVVQDIISFANNTDLPIENVIAGKYPYFELLTQQIKRVDTLYQVRKHERNVMDYDDLLMNIQGARHDISRTCLNAWGYTELFDRIAPRLPLISQAAEREFARSSRRYQRVVQLALTSVALLAAIDFVVGLYEMSIEGTGTIPSIASRALAALSESNADVLLLLGLLAGIIVAVVQSAGGGPR